MNFSSKMFSDLRRVSCAAVFAVAFGFVGVCLLTPAVAGLGDGVKKRVTGDTSVTAHEQIDRFVEARLKEKGMSPNADIDGATFVRRVYLNIAGRIPPSRRPKHFMLTAIPTSGSD